MLDIRTGSVGWQYGSSGRMDIKPSAGLKKALFCEPQPEQNRDDLQNMLDEIKESKKGAWNFDFETHQPLLGSYQWERVVAEVPEATTQDQTDTATEPTANANQTTENRSQVLPNTPSRQGKIDEYFRKRKRGSPSSSSVTSAKRSLSSEDGSLSSRSRFRPISKPDSPS